MKEATGEVNMTVITIVIVGFVLAAFTLLWPTIRDSISGTWSNHIATENATTAP